MVLAIQDTQVGHTHGIQAAAAADAAGVAGMADLKLVHGKEVAALVEAEKHKGKEVEYSQEWLAAVGAGMEESLMDLAYSQDVLAVGSLIFEADGVVQQKHS